MIAELTFEKAYDTALTTLVKMKQSLDAYRRRTSHNKQYAQEKEQELIRLGHFVEASIHLIDSLKAENEKAYEAGFERGKKQSPYVRHEYRRKDHNLFDLLVMTKLDPFVLRRMCKRIARNEGKGVLRRLTIAKSEATWPELY